MTHSNHRRGDRESINSDYVVLVRYETPKSHEETSEVVKILGDHNPVGLTTRHFGVPLRYMRGWKEGLGLKELVEHPDFPAHVAGVYDNREDIEGLIKDLVEADIGYSIVVSGDFDTVSEICSKTGTGPHTMNMSLGTIGRTELLPDDRILEITTMCGHGLVGEHLARHLIDRVRKGRTTAQEAALELGKQCICNFFNAVRAEKIINEYTTLQR
jgi:hypothetical protein